LYETGIGVGVTGAATGPVALAGDAVAEGFGMLVGVA
jgi:hypothetical protein